MNIRVGTYAAQQARRLARYYAEPLCAGVRSLGHPHQHDHHVMTFEAERRRCQNAAAIDAVISAARSGTLDQLLWS